MGGRGRGRDGGREIQMGGRVYNLLCLELPLQVRVVNVFRSSLESRHLNEQDTAGAGHYQGNVMKKDGTSL